jgi:ADP-heptose:LPS heptosyltransferase
VKILLVRCDGLGDALVCTPLVAALRDAGHELGVVLGTHNRDAFAARTFARVHVLERIPWPRHGSTPQTRRPALAEVRAAGYDAALVASEELDAYRFAADAGIARRVGFVNGWEKPLKTVRAGGLLTERVPRTASATRAAEHEVETVFRLGAAFVREPAPTCEPVRLKELVLDDAPAPQRFVAVQTSAKLREAGLDRATYVALARAILASGRAVRLFGDDPALVRDVAWASGAEPVTGLSLRAWKAHLAAAWAVVTPDSGAAHVAGMLGVPCVVAFPPGRATARDVARWRPWAARYRTIVLDRSRPAEARAMVLAAAIEDVTMRRG